MVCLFSLEIVDVSLTKDALATRLRPGLVPVASSRFLSHLQTRRLFQDDACGNGSADSHEVSAS